MRPDSKPDRRLVWAALAAIYILWGSTYLGIKVVNGSLPPILSGSVRFALAALILGGGAAAAGELRHGFPSRRQILNAAASGALLFGGGNAGVVLAEQRLDSGLVALLVSISPLLIGLYLLVGFREPLGWIKWVGLVVGLAGLLLLMRTAGGNLLDPFGLAMALASPITWSAGSVWASRADLPHGALVGSSVQLLSGSVVMAVEGVAIGEPWRYDLHHATWGSLIGLAYLVIFGSVVAFTAFSFLLRAVHVSLVATSAYVNPLVAVILGALLAGEHVTSREVVGGAVILVAVALIVSGDFLRRVERADAPIPPDPG